MKLNEEQLKLGLRNSLAAVNLKLLAAKTHRCLSLYDSLPDLLILTDRKEEKKRKKLARVSNPQTETRIVPYLQEVSLGDVALVEAAL